MPKPRKARASKKNSSAESPAALSSDIPSPTSSNPSFDSILDFPSLLDIETSTIDTIPESVGNPFFPNGPPSNLDDLFFEPDFVYRYLGPEFNWDEIRRSPEPRPLSPAVESTPPLERFRALHFNYSSESELSLLLQSYQTSPLTTLSQIDGQSIGIHHSQVPVQQLPPTPYDFALKRMADLNTIPATIPETDFRNIFGLDYENFLEQATRPMSSWFSLSYSS